MSNARASHPTGRGRLGGRAARLGLLGVLWVALVEGQVEGLVAGLVALPLAAWASLAFESTEGARVRPLALGRMLPLFLWRSLRGSFDVGWRALHPRLPVSPGWMEVRLRLPAGAARLFLSSLLSLVPGTLAVEVVGEVLSLHLLDARPRTRASILVEVRRLEDAVARVFGLPAPAREGA
jgi:multicomponent Na+:H+ antiporter subunit E